jgi:putative transposase
LSTYTNCKNKISGKKGYPKYSKRTRSFELKQSGWKLNRDTKRITFTDKKNIGDIIPQLEPTQKCVGIDVGLKYFYADSNGKTIDCPKYYRQGEKCLNKLNRRKSRKLKKGQKKSNNYIKVRKKYSKGHLKVSRQREEFAKEKALRLIQSNDLVAYEDLKVRNLVRNRPPLPPLIKGGQGG